jgi:hypothetical protein
MPQLDAITEVDILNQVVSKRRRSLRPETARALLDLHFNAEAQRTIRLLLRKNRRAKITAEERIVLEKYLRLGQLLDLLHAI